MYYRINEMMLYMNKLPRDTQIEKKKKEIEKKEKQVRSLETRVREGLTHVGQSFSGREKMGRGHI